MRNVARVAERVGRAPGALRETADSAEVVETLP